MREKDKEDVTAHEYLITPPRPKKRMEETQKKRHGSRQQFALGAATHTKNKTHTH
jgi:hypothetical protein